MAKDFLYKQIADNLINKIQNGEYKIHTYLENAETLARYYSTSVITVNKALSILVSLGYIKRIPGKGSQVLQTSPESFNSQKKKYSKLIGVIVYDISYTSICSLALKAIENYLFPLGYQLIIGNDMGDAEKAVEYVKRFHFQKVDGIIYVPISCVDKKEYSHCNERVLEALDDSGIPYVLMHQILPNTSAAQISFDDYYDTAELIESLFADGCQNPLLFSYAYYNSEKDEKERGFTDVMRSKGFSEPERYIVQNLPHYTENERDEMEIMNFFSKAIEERPETDAIITINSYHLNIIYHMQYSSPLFSERSITFNGFGNINEYINKKNIRHLQKNFPEKLGELTIEILLSIIKGKQSYQDTIIRIPSELYIHT